MSHHSILAATLNGTNVILCEHTNSERGYLPVFRNILSRALDSGVEIILSKKDADPIHRRGAAPDQVACRACRSAFSRRASHFLV